MSSLFIRRLGLACPLGLGTKSAQYAIGAGLCAFSDTEVLDESGEPVRAAHLPLLGSTLNREERMLFFARHALLECLSGLDPGRLPEVHVFMALPEEDGRWLDEAGVMQKLRAMADPELPMDWSARPVKAGRAGFFIALQAAAEMLSSGRARAALLGGVDSGCDQASLEHYVREGRVLDQSNPDGLLPGEGAGFMLMMRSDAGVGQEALGRVQAWATSRDGLPWNERNPMKAEGLSSVFKQLRRANAGQGRPQQVYSCQTGEGFWAREMNHAYLRNVELMPEPFQVSLLAEALGDVGAGAGIIQVGMACFGFEHGERAGRKMDKALLYGAGDGGGVGGCVVGRASGG